MRNTIKGRNPAIKACRNSNNEQFLSIKTIEKVIQQKTSFSNKLKNCFTITKRQKKTQFNQ